MKRHHVPKQAIGVIIAAVVLTAIYFTIDYMDNLKKPPDGTYYGTVEYGETAVSAEVSGILTSLPLQEGSAVSPGQVVATLRSDTANADASIQSIGAQIADNQAKLSQESARAEQIGIQENTIKQLDAQIAQARSAASKAASLVAVRDNDVKSAKIKVNDAKKSYDDLTTLLASGAVDSNQVTLAKSAYDTALNAYDSAMKSAAAARNDLESANKQVESLGYQKKAASEALKLLESPLRPEEVQNAELAAKQQGERLKLSDITLSKTRLIAIVGGRIERVNFDVGEFVPAGAKVAVVSDPSKLSMKIYVSEKDLAAVKEGMKIKLKSTVTGKEADGKVVRIAGQAMFTPMNIVTVNDRAKLVFEVKVDIQSPEKDAFKAGMLVEARIK